MQRYRNQLLVGLGFMALVIVIAVILTDLRTLTKNLGNFPLWLVGVLFLMKSVNWFFRYLEWQYFLNVMDVKTVLYGETRPAIPPDQPATVRFQDSFILWMSSLPFSVSPGKSAEMLKTLIFKNMTHTPIVHTAPIVIAERVVDGIAISLMVGLPLLFASEWVLASDNIEANYVQLVSLGTILLVVAMLIVIQFKSFSLKILHFLGKLPVLRRFENTFVALYESSYRIARLRHIMITTSFGILAYALDCIAVYWMLLGLGLPPSTELFVQSMFVLSISGIIGAISTLPGGAGARELTIGGLSTALMGLSTGVAGTWVIMVSMFQLWLGVIIGIILAIIFHNRFFPDTLEQELIEMQQHKSQKVTV